MATRSRCSCRVRMRPVARKNRYGAQRMHCEKQSVGAAFEKCSARCVTLFLGLAKSTGPQRRRIGRCEQQVTVHSAAAMCRESIYRRSDELNNLACGFDLGVDCVL